MENILLEYLKKSFPETETRKRWLSGPVVTISREFGCPSKLVAQMLTESLNHRSLSGESHTWQFINKEIIEEAAKELELNANEVYFMINSGNRGILSDVLASFTNAYVSTPRLKKTITRILLELEQKGHVVVVGRGAVGVLHGHPNAVHVRLVAPLDWRSREICLARGISLRDAEKMAIEIDEKRKSLIELLSGVKFSPYLFDIFLNCQSLSLNEINEAIIGVMVAKNMLA
jgi:cytidylate kinase